MNLPIGARSYIDRTWCDHPNDEQLASNLRSLGYNVSPRQVRRYRLQERVDMGLEPFLRAEEATPRKTTEFEKDLKRLAYNLPWRAGLIIGAGALAFAVHKCSANKNYDLHGPDTVVENR